MLFILLSGLVINLTLWVFISALLLHEFLGRR